MGEPETSIDMKDHTVVLPVRRNVKFVLGEKHKRLASKLSDYYINLPLVALTLLPIIVVYYFNLCQFLFSDSEYYGIHVTAIAKICAFLVILFVMLYYFRSTFVIIFKNYYHRIHLRVIWIVTYFVLINIHVSNFVHYGIFHLNKIYVFFSLYTIPHFYDFRVFQM